jgi:hypothetical protein
VSPHRRGDCRESPHVAACEQAATNRARLGRCLRAERGRLARIGSGFNGPGTLLAMSEAAPIADQGRAVATLTSAFTNDPVMRWMWPEPAAYLAHFPRLVVAFGGKAFGEGTAWGLTDTSAVALWLEPGVEAEGDDITDVLIGSVAADKHEDMVSVLEQMDEAHPT